MRQIVTTGIVLKRINFGEADRIITVITPDNGKLRLMAKGVRKVKSKLAGGIELFSLSAITFIPGKRDISTLVSTRLVTHYGNIVANIERTTLGYELLKLIEKSTQDNCDEEFFELLLHGLQGLNETTIEPAIVESWFRLNLLKLLGHEPNFSTDAMGSKLIAGEKYVFDFDTMAFSAHSTGTFNDKHIKLLRLYLSHPPEKVMQVSEATAINQKLVPLLKNITTYSGNN